MLLARGDKLEMLNKICILKYLLTIWFRPVPAVSEYMLKPAQKTIYTC